MSNTLRFVVLCAVVAAAGCWPEDTLETADIRVIRDSGAHQDAEGGETAGDTGSGHDGSAAADTASAGTADSDAPDSHVPDTNKTDSESSAGDATSIDGGDGGGAQDAGPGEGDVTDVTSSDADLADGSGADADEADGADGAVSDAGIEAGGAADGALADAGPTDTGPTDTVPMDTGPTDTGSTDTGPTDTGPTDTGPSQVASCFIAAQCPPTGNPCVLPNCVDNVCVQLVVDFFPCDDGEPCTQYDGCVAGQCVGNAGFGAKGTCPCKSDTDCAAKADGDPCNGGLRCVAGFCAQTPASLVTCSDDGNPCTVQSCDPKTGKCVHQPMDAWACSDGNPCTDADFCVAGSCKAGPNSCSCKGDGDCPGAAGASDKCVKGWGCVQGGCVPLKAVSCPGGGPCVANACDPKTGVCKAGAVAVPCDDGNPCTVGDICAKGACAPGDSLCPCKGDSDCAAVDDADLCTAPLVCTQGKCAKAAGGDVTCDTSGDGPCAHTSCQATTGKCAKTPTASGKACDDGNPCTSGETCQGGSCAGGKVLCQCSKDSDCLGKSKDLCVGDFACVGGTCKPNPAKQVLCPPPTAGGCLLSACDPKTGACKSTPAPDGKACGDAEVCVSRACKGGSCVATPSCPCTTNAQCAAKDDGDLCNGTLVCDHSLPKPHCAPDPATVPVCQASLPDSCLATVCSPKSGACVLGPQVDGGPCEDGSSCTTAEFCVNGTCVAGKLKPECGCKADADCALYDDGDPCTGVWGCELGPKGGTCAIKAGTVPKCPKGGPGPCLGWACDPASGTCKAMPAPGPCDDGVPCTTGDTCKGGQCTSSKNSCGCLADADCAATNLCLGAAYCDKSGSNWTCKQSPAGAKVCDTSGDGACIKSVCDPATGACKKTPAANGVACPHGAPCPGLGACSAGVCKPPKSCACVTDKDCKDDGNPCNGTPYCQAKSGGTVCVTNPATVITCDHLSETACATWACDPKLGKCAAKPKAKGTPCKGPTCTTAACDGGTCKVTKQLCQCTSHAECQKAGANKCGGVAYCDFATFPFTCKVSTTSTISCDQSKAGPCQVNSCDPATGACKLSPKPKGTACSDGELCTTGDACEGGVCKPGKNTCACKTDADCVAQEDGNLCNGTLYCRKDTHVCAVRPESVVLCPPDVDGDACRVPTCQPATGQCKQAPANPGKSCDDGDPCTPKSTCQGGACVGKSSGCACSKDADCAAKDDGDPCTGVLTCQQGQCALKPGSVPDCQGNDDPGCAQQVCDPKTGGCVAKSSDGKSCDDGVACLLNDTCKGGKCKGATNACVCTPGDTSKCWGMLNLFELDQLCDGKPVCAMTAGWGPGAIDYKCVLPPGSEVVCDNSTDTTCIKATCDTSDGKCKMTPINEGKLCDDGDPCVVNTQCKQGTCGGSGTNICTCGKDADCAGKEDGDLCNGSLACDLKTKTCKLDPASTVWCDPAKDTQCLQHVCLPDKGTCTMFKKTHSKVEYLYKMVGKPPDLKLVVIGEKVVYFKTKVRDVWCNDGDACTANDACEGDKCVGPDAICQCTKDADCAAKDNGNLCDGTLRCNVGKGKCEVDLATVVSCPAATSPCQTGVCVPKTGKCALQPKPDYTPCDDGNPCTASDDCQAGSCTAGTQVCSCKKDSDCLDDGNLCNGTPYCDATGSCKIDPATKVTCEGPGESQCTAWTCQPKTGKCVLSAANDKQPCVLKGDPCWVSPVCSGGVCQATAYACCKTDAECAASAAQSYGCNAVGYCDKSQFKPQCAIDKTQKVWCDPLKGDQCNDWTCHPQTGKCGLVPKAAATACQDGDPCTATGSCFKGTCKPGLPVCACKSHADCVAGGAGDLCKGTAYCAVAADGKRSCQLNPTSVPVCPAPPASSCKIASCVSTTGACATTPAPNGTPCGGGKVCIKGKCS